MHCRSWLVLAVVSLYVLSCLAEDYYKVLGVPKDASEKQIRSAFKKLSLKYHPDKNTEDPDAAEKFVAVSEAYQILSDPEKREQYDKFGESAFKRGGGGGPQQGGHQGFHGFGGGGGAGGSPFQDAYTFFNSFFGGKAGHKFGFGGDSGGASSHFNFGQGAGGAKQQSSYSHSSYSSSSSGPKGQQQHQQHSYSSGHPGAGARSGAGGARSGAGGHPGAGAGAGAGNAENQRKASTKLYEYSADILHTTMKKYEEKVKPSLDAWLIHFYSTDSTSQNFVEQFEKVSQQLKYYVNVSAVNFDSESSLAHELGVKEAPALIGLPYGPHTKPQVYSGEWDAQKVVDFALELMPDFTHTITGLNDKFFDDQTLPKVLLFSAKSNATPLLKALARDLRKKFRFALVPQKLSSVLKSYQIDKVPALVVTDVDGSIKQYKGEMKYLPMLQFLRSFKKEAATATPPQSASAKMPQHQATDGRVHELTSDNIDQLCGTEVCLVLFTQDAAADDNFALAKDIALRYQKDGLSVAYVDRKNLNFLTRLLELSPHKRCGGSDDDDARKSAGECVLVALRYGSSPSRDKFAWAPTSSPLEKEKVFLFVDRVVGGDVQWIREPLPKL